jgi:hypothetical protein
LGIQARVTHGLKIPIERERVGNAVVDDRSSVNVSVLVSIFRMLGEERNVVLLAGNDESESTIEDITGCQHWSGERKAEKTYGLKVGWIR